MCGRISQAREVMDYLQSIGLPESRVFDEMPVPHRFNVAPGTRPLAIHMLAGTDEPAAEPIRWSYHSGWAKKENRQPDINATIEKALGRYWKPLWSKGRLIIPADGWYEWTGPKKERQPWHIRARDGEPIFMAAISNWKAEPAERAEDAGFAIVTSASLGGMVDVHDRRPIVFTADDAKEWLDMDFSAEHAENLARTAALPSEAFEWYQVTRAVGNNRNDGPEMIVPITSDENRITLG